MDKRLGVDVLDSGNELIGEKENGLQREFAVAEIEEIFQTGAKEIEHHGVVVTLGAEPTNERDTHTTGQRFVDTSFIFELRVLRLDRLKFDGNLLSRDDVGAQVNITE